MHCRGAAADYPADPECDRQIDDVAVGIHDEEASHAPWLVRQGMDHLVAWFDSLGVDTVDVVGGEVGNDSANAHVGPFGRGRPSCLVYDALG